MSFRSLRVATIACHVIHSVTAHPTRTKKIVKKKRKQKNRRTIRGQYRGRRKGGGGGGCKGAATAASERCWRGKARKGLRRQRWGVWDKKRYLTGVGVPALRCVSLLSETVLKSFRFPYLVWNTTGKIAQYPKTAEREQQATDHRLIAFDSRAAAPCSHLSPNGVKKKTPPKKNNRRGNSRASTDLDRRRRLPVNGRQPRQVRRLVVGIRRRGPPHHRVQGAHRFQYHLGAVPGRSTTADPPLAVFFFFVYAVGASEWRAGERAVEVGEGDGFMVEGEEHTERKRKKPSGVQ